MLAARFSPSCESAYVRLPEKQQRQCGIEKLSMFIPTRLQLREFRIVRDLFLQDFRIDVVSGRFLFERARQHHRTDDRHQQQHARDFKRQRRVAIKTAPRPSVSFVIGCCRSLPGSRVPDLAAAALKLRGGFGWSFCKPRSPVDGVEQSADEQKQKIKLVVTCAGY
jgi:hypothetical protein